MDSETTAPIRAPYVGMMSAQENADPNRAGVDAVAAVVAAKSTVKAATAPSTPKAPPKSRRPLQSVDCNSAPPSVTSRSACSPARPPANLAKCSLPGGELKTRVPQNVAKRPRTVEEVAARPMLVSRVVVATGSPERVEGDGIAPQEALENENLAWMDMMLALLEKKYGPQHAIPISLADLEDAKMLQPRNKKRRASDGAANALTARTRTNSAAGLPLLQATPALKVRAEASRLVLEREEKEREERRRRLLLRHAQQVQDSSMRSSTSCGCKTGCLKMYCVCFSSRGFCHPNCSCDDCKNSRANKEQRLEAIQSYLANDPRAFSFSSYQQENANTTGFLQLLPQKSNAVVQRGCRCKKSKCLKKYCECFQNNIACTAHCRCVDCSNHSEATHRFQGDVRVASGLKQASMSAASPTAQPFHQVQVIVTKQPKRNHVRKSIRLSL